MSSRSASSGYLQNWRDEAYERLGKGCKLNCPKMRKRVTKAKEQWKPTLPGMKDDFVGILS